MCVVCTHLSIALSASLLTLAAHGPVKGSSTGRRSGSKVPQCVLRVLQVLPLLTVCWKTGVSCRSQNTGSFPILALSAYQQQLKQHPFRFAAAKGLGDRGHASRTCE